MTREPTAPEVLGEQILATARHEAEQRLARARAEAEARRERAETEANAWRTAELARAQSEAERRRTLVLGALAVEHRKRRLARVALLLETVHDEARQQLCCVEPTRLPALLLGLSLAAARQLDDGPLRIKLSTAEHQTCGPDLALQLAAQLGRARGSVEVVAVADQRGPGPVVEQRDGRRAWDNRLLVRLERLWPELRGELRALLFDRAGGSEP